jgi:hypothetical protein
MGAVPRSETFLHDGQISPQKQGIRLVCSSSLSAGELVYVSGYDATLDCFLVTKSDADVPNAVAQYVVAAALSANTMGRGRKAFLLTDVATNGSTVGDPVYLSTVAGGWTLTAPSSTSARQQIVGRVKVVNASTGVIAFNLAEGAHPVGKLAGTQIQNGSVPSAALDDTLLHTVTGSLTNAQMLALATSPVEMVAAPGAGFVLEFVSGALFFDHTAAYTEPSAPDDMVIRYTDGSGGIVSQDVDATGFLTAAGDAMAFIAPLHGAITTVRLKAACDNQALVLHNTGGNYGGGNAANVVRFSISYRIRAAGW